MKKFKKGEFISMITPNGDLLYMVYEHPSDEEIYLVSLFNGLTKEVINGLYEINISDSMKYSISRKGDHYYYEDKLLQKSTVSQEEVINSLDSFTKNAIKNLVVHIEHCTKQMSELLKEDGKENLGLLENFINNSAQKTG